MSRLLALPLALLATYVAAQTFTSCNPLNSTCPQDPALGTTFETTFNSSMSEFDPRFFNVTAGTDLISFSDNGAEMTIAKEGDSVTVKTAFYIMFGHVEMMFQAATGQGIISTMVMLSDDLDEIDWEIMGGNTSYVENNFYGWGNQSQYNAKYMPVNWPGGAMGGMHNYTMNWSQDEIQWLLDGEVVRTQPYLPPGEYPQTPSYLTFGIWAGGASSEPKGTRIWAGGDTDFSKAPFTMTLQSLKVVDSHTDVAWYAYGDQSGSFNSIKAIPGKSNAHKAMTEKSFTENAEKQWNGLSTGAKIGIACGVLGVFAVFFAAFILYCIKQRRQGKAEKALADKEWEAQYAEFVQYRDRMRKGGFAVSHMGHGEKYI